MENTRHKKKIIIYQKLFFKKSGTVAKKSKV